MLQIIMRVTLMFQDLSCLRLQIRKQLKLMYMLQEAKDPHEKAVLDGRQLALKGIKLTVCSAATKSSVILCLESLIGNDRFKGLNCFLAGDDVKEKKPNPSIYITAAKSLGVSEKSCMVVEDSVIGLQAAKGAGMSCVISYTSSTSNQDFTDAIAIYPDLSNVSLANLDLLLQNAVVAK